MTRALLFSLTNVVSGGTYQQADRSSWPVTRILDLSRRSFCRPLLASVRTPDHAVFRRCSLQATGWFKFLGCGSWCLVQGETDAERDQHYNDFFEKIQAQVQGNVARDRTPSLIASEVVPQAVEVAYK